MKVKEKYQGLSREQLLDKAHELGSKYEINSYSCSQCTTAAIHEIVGIDEAVVKSATSLCAGNAFQLVGSCGGLIGGTMALDYFFGRPFGKMSYTEVLQENIDPLFTAQAVAREFFDKYVNEYGTITCAGIMQKRFGRVYYIEDPEEFKKFEEAGAHTDPQKCAGIVGNATRWVMEILIDKGVVEVNP